MNWFLKEDEGIYESNISKFECGGGCTTLLIYQKSPKWWLKLINFVLGRLYFSYSSINYERIMLVVCYKLCTPRSWNVGLYYMDDIDE